MNVLIVHLYKRWSVVLTQQWYGWPPVSLTLNFSDVDPVSVNMATQRRMKYLLGFKSIYMFIIIIIYNTQLCVSLVYVLV